VSLSTDKFGRIRFSTAVAAKYMDTPKLGGVYDRIREIPG